VEVVVAFVYEHQYDVVYIDLAATVG